MKKLILSITLLTSFSMAQALEFKSFNFNDESDCAEQLGQQPVSLPYDIIDVNHLSKSKEICLQAYTGDNACRKEYARQKDALGLTSGIRSNYTAEQEKQAQQQCGSWLKQRRSACESFLQKASVVCYQLNSQTEQQQQRQTEALADNLLGTWKGIDSDNYHDTLYINNQISNSKFSGIMYTKSNDCSASQRMDISVYNGVAYLQGTVLSTTCKSWYADNFELSISNGVMRGTITDLGGSSSNTVLRKQ